VKAVAALKDKQRLCRNIAKDFTKFLKRDTLQCLAETGEMRSLLKTDLELCLEPLLLRQAEECMARKQTTELLLTSLLQTSINKREY
jgi:hypothetical protein